MVSTIYVALLGQPGLDPGLRQPAFRAWADALLVRLAPDLNSNLAPSIAVRTTGQIGRRLPSTPFVEPLDDHGLACALALPSETLPLFTPTGWSENLVEYLTDVGIAKEVIEEHLPVCAAPRWPTMVMALPGVLAGIRPDLLELVARYFGPDVCRYLKSWRPLTSDAWLSEEPLEVVVPNGGPEDVTE